MKLTLVGWLLVVGIILSMTTLYCDSHDTRKKESEKFIQDNKGQVTVLAWQYQGDSFPLIVEGIVTKERIRSISNKVYPLPGEVWSIKTSSSGSIEMNEKIK